MIERSQQNSNCQSSLQQSPSETSTRSQASKSIISSAYKQRKQHLSSRSSLSSSRFSSPTETVFDSRTNKERENFDRLGFNHINNNNENDEYDEDRQTKDTNSTVSQEELNSMISTKSSRSESTKRVGSCSRSILRKKNEQRGSSFHRQLEADEDEGIEMSKHGEDDATEISAPSSIQSKDSNYIKPKRRRQGKRQYFFGGEERSTRKNESLTTYDYDSDDYEDMASKREHLQKLSFVASSQGSSVYNSNDSNDSYDSYESDEDDKSQMSLVSRTVQKVTERTRKSSRNGNEEVLKKKHAKACKHLRTGNYVKSLELFEEILSGLVTKYGKRHHRVGTAMHNIGIVHLRAGDLDLAVDAINVAVKIREDALGIKHPKVADSLVELGIIYLSRKEFQESLSVFNEALALREEKVEKDIDDKKLNLQVAKVLNNIGCVYFEYGELNNALKTFEAALEVQQKFLGADDPAEEPGVLSMASTMCNIAYVHIDDENFTPAIYMLEQALQIQEAVLEADNKLVLNTLDNLAYTYFRNGSYREAMKNYEDILDTQIQAVGPNHLDCAAPMKKIAYLHIKECEFQKALTKLLQAIEIEKKHLDPDDRVVRQTSKMINEMNYQLLKFPRIWEVFVTALKRKGVFKNPITCQSLDFGCLGTSDSTVDTRGIGIKPPRNSSKMAGHKVAYA